jgi:nitrite reductase/ring-hydroxylating ferredoxin subunit
MGKLVFVANKIDLKDGEMREVNAGGQDILLARIDNSYYAADSHCPHLRGNLVKGKLKGTVVSCPLQGSQFDLVTGKVVYWAGCADPDAKPETLLRTPRPLTTYKVRLEGDKVLVEI